MNNLHIIQTFNSHVYTFTWPIGYIYNDLSRSQVVGINLKASFGIRKPFAIERCENVIKTLDLPLKIKDSDHNYFQVIIL